MSDIADLRVSYERDALDETHALEDPFEQFSQWFEDARNEPSLMEPSAMTVATVSPDGQPSARIVLLRGFDERGFVFFTNYESRKGQELASTPQSALLFYWPPLEREVRIEGRAQRLSAVESDAYFARRPRGHRLSAWASPQSQPIAQRADLESALEAASARFPDDVPRPAHWGGYRVVPEHFEFWQGRRNRLHDRLTYTRAAEDTTWTRQRLAP